MIHVYKEVSIYRMKIAKLTITMQVMMIEFIWFDVTMVYFT